MAQRTRVPVVTELTMVMLG